MSGLNVVRPGRPEQSPKSRPQAAPHMAQSQCSPAWKTGTIAGLQHAPHISASLNVVRPGRPEQYTCEPKRGLYPSRLNVVRPGRPEQFFCTNSWTTFNPASQCSPAWKTGTIMAQHMTGTSLGQSQCSPAWKTGTIWWRCKQSGIQLIRLNVVRPGRPEQ